MLSRVRGHGAELGLDPAQLDQLHLHFPAGGQSKAGHPQLQRQFYLSNVRVSVRCWAGQEGPSAGVAITLAVVSLLAATPLPAGLAATGEISLRGLVLPVGGVRDKLLAAARAGIQVLTSSRADKQN